MMTRVTIHAATAVAARIVKNQNKRFPRRTKRLGSRKMHVARSRGWRVLAENSPCRMLPRGRR